MKKYDFSKHAVYRFKQRFPSKVGKNVIRDILKEIKTAKHVKFTTYGSGSHDTVEQLENSDIIFICKGYTLLTVYTTKGC